jgi:hypothetical protein
MVMNTNLQDSSNMNLSRIDNYGNHTFLYKEDKGTNWGSYSGGWTYYVGRSLIGLYKNRGYETDSNLLVLEVLFGYYNSIDDFNSLNLDNIDVTDSRGFIGFNISLYYSRTNVVDGTIRGQDWSDYSKTSFSSDVLKSAAIITRFSPSKIESKKFKVNIPLQLIKNGSSCFLTFNNGLKALPRIGNIQVSSPNGTRLKKSIIFASNSTGYYDGPGYNYYPSSILLLEGNNFNYGRPNILSSKTFNNLGDKIPSMPIYCGIDDANPSTNLDFNLQIDGFLQTCANFSSQAYSEYIINGGHYTNLGNCFLMRE